jgi:hypothetical protein
MTPLDPAYPFPTEPAAVQADKFGDLSRRVGWLERGGRAPGMAVAAVGAGAPSHDWADGALYLDLTNARLYARANGTWRWVALT